MGSRLKRQKNDWGPWVTLTASGKTLLLWLLIFVIFCHLTFVFLILFCLFCLSKDQKDTKKVESFPDVITNNSKPELLISLSPGQSRWIHSWRVCGTCMVDTILVCSLKGLSISKFTLIDTLLLCCTNLKAKQLNTHLSRHWLWHFESIKAPCVCGVVHTGSNHLMYRRSKPESRV
jgi:hypothetical protein